MSVTVDPVRLEYEMAIRGLNATDLAELAGVSDATVSTTLAGKPISTTSLRLIAAALRAAPVDPVIEKLLAQRPKVASLGPSVPAGGEG